MPDRSHILADKELEEIEKRIEEVYKRANKEIEEKAAVYFKRFEALDKQKRALVEAGEMTEEAYRKWKQGKIMTGKHWEALKRQTAERMNQANNVAAEYANKRLPSVYASNYNQIASGINDQVQGRVNFELVNENTVRNLATQDKTLLPYKTVNGVKDVRWNTQKVNGEILQGILQGDSVADLSKRLRKVTAMNEASAVRNARTSVTSAENKGRLDMLHDAEDAGVRTKKVWLSVHDKRTRDAHLALSGVEADPDEPFEVFGMEIMYPGDPDAEPEMVYNCRCTMTYKVIGFDSQQTGQQTAHYIANGRDISDSFERRREDFDFAIDDVMNAQGFDGLPKVVSDEEFNEIVKENGFVAQRTYSAPDQETLEAYRKQLYEGKWYVDCGEGGSVYGQGMYGCASKDGNISAHMKNEMDHYMRLNGSKLGGESMSNSSKINMIDSYIKSHDLHGEKADAVKAFLSSQTGVSRPSKEEIDLVKSVLGRDGMKALRTDIQAINGSFDNARSIIETFTLDKSAKIISYDDLMKLAHADNAWDKMSRARSSDVGVLATMLGYDGIYVNSSDYVVVLNRTKMIINRGV